ncbi:TIGR04086 family membrane protein [Paenibacillus silviterrae]|uniref:TIGR04086 family membrane protein n=1 Tax=Paenibacillus silviterrae TaxID=3242194 RepID=UPI0025427019|nr:TIGR04086 family membrane protein [Paenibacillus chinjuensis]
MNRSPMFSGLMYSMIFMLAGTVLGSMLLVFTSMQEDSWVSLTLGIHGLAMLAGGFVSGKRAGTKGWYHGMLLGLLYALIVWIIGFLAYDAGMTEQTLYVTLISVVGGAFGGIVGVNMKR